MVRFSHVREYIVELMVFFIAFFQIGAVMEAATDGITAGTSIAGTTAAFAGLDYTVMYKLELTNYSSTPLHFDGNKVTSGYAKRPPRAVLPSTREAMMGMY
jgi:hypothetical protein